jgi:hypothetical protein
LRWFLILPPKDVFQGSHITTKKIAYYKGKIERIFDMTNLQRMRKYVRVEISHPPTFEIFFIRDDINI